MRTRAGKPEAAESIDQPEVYQDVTGKKSNTRVFGFDDAVAVLSLRESHRKKLRTTNAMERLNEEIRRRERVIRIFPDEE